MPYIPMRFINGIVMLSVQKLITFEKHMSTSDGYVHDFHAFHFDQMKHVPVKRTKLKAHIFAKYIYNETNEELNINV